MFETEKGRKLYQTLFSAECVQSFQVLQEAMDEKVFYEEKKNRLISEMSNRCNETEDVVLLNSPKLEESYEFVEDYSKIDELYAKNQAEIDQKEKRLRELNEYLSNASKNKRLEDIKEKYERYKYLDEKYPQEILDLDQEILDAESSVEFDKDEIKDIQESIQKAEEERRLKEEENQHLSREIEGWKKALEERIAIQATLSQHQNENFSDEMDEATKKTIQDIKIDTSTYMENQKRAESLMEENKKIIQLNNNIISDLKERQSQLEKSIKADEEEIDKKKKELEQKKIEKNENSKKLEEQEQLYRFGYAKEEKQLTSEREALVNSLENLKKQQNVLGQVASDIENCTEKYQEKYNDLQKVVDERKELKAPDFNIYLGELAECVKAACNRFVSQESMILPGKKRKNSSQYKDMMDALISAEGKKPEEIRDLLGEIRQKASNYKEAKDKQWRPFASTVRKARLAMADALIDYCDKMTKQYGVLAEMKKPKALTPEQREIIDKSHKMLTNGKLAKEDIRKAITTQMNKDAQDLKELEIPKDVDALEDVPVNEAPKKKQAVIIDK